MASVFFMYSNFWPFVTDSFTTTQKKDKDWKVTLADRVREHVHKYDRMIIFQFVNPRTDLTQEIRKRFRSSR